MLEQDRFLRYGKRDMGVWLWPVIDDESSAREAGAARRNLRSHPVPALHLHVRFAVPIFWQAPQPRCLRQSYFLGGQRLGVEGLAYLVYRCIYGLRSSGNPCGCKLECVVVRGFAFRVPRAYAWRSRCFSAATLRECTTTDGTSRSAIHSTVTGAAWLPMHSDPCCYYRFKGEYF